MRIYELAKQLGVANKDILAKLPELGIVVKSHASSLTPEQARVVMQIFKPEIGEQARVEAPTPAPVPQSRKAPAPAPAPRTAEKPAPRAPEPKRQEDRRRHFRQAHERARNAAPAEEVPAQKPAEKSPVEPAKPVIVIRDGLTVKELAERMQMPPAKLIPTLMNAGIMASINQRIALDAAELVAIEHGFAVKKEELFKASEIAEAATDKGFTQRPRPPVVTIMGHVDHGKTLLLDYIRRTNVVAGEAGGITQHIGAYTAVVPGGKQISFIDTPGHAAFTAMRARGASVTDIVVLVVAADDGIMPQTEEAIHHAQAAGVPIIVAINKCDLPAANPNMVKQQLAEKNLVGEDWGGQTIMVEVSAKTGKNVDKLLEMILLQAEMMELKAAVDAPARGVVIEAQLDKSRGPLATVLVRQGTLRIGQNFICGMTSGRVRALMSADGARLKEVPPACPAVVLGFDGMPAVGDVLQGIADSKEARYIAEERAAMRREETLQKQQKLTLEDIQRQISAGEQKELGLVVKADVAGSVEAIRDALEHLPAGKVNVKLLHGGVGAINETDVNLALASKALIIGFNVRPIPTAEAIAARSDLEIRYYNIIYKLIEDLTLAMQGLLEPIKKETVTGHAEVRNTFKVSKVGMIAGCYVTDGTIKRNSMVRVVRDGKVAYTGRIGSLRRFKDDVKEVGVTFECGIGIENFNDVKVGDVLEAYVVTTEAAQI